MKTTYPLLALFLLFSFANCRHSKPDLKIPSEVITSFNSRFAEAKSAHWERGDSDKLEVDFKFQERIYTAVFKTNGDWLQSGKKIGISELPATVNRTLEEGFAEYRIKSIEQVESAKRGHYFSIKMNDGKDNKEIELSYSGVIINPGDFEEEPE